MGPHTERTAAAPEPLVLPGQATCGRAARRWMSEQVVAMGRDDLIDVVELSVTEVVTNPVTRAGTTVRHDQTLPVRDPDGRLGDHAVNPMHRLGYSRTATTGRGTRRSDSWAASWGSVPVEDDGTVTWLVDELQERGDD